MKRLIIGLTLILLVVILAAPITIMASNISGAQYYATILVTNNSTATTNVATTANISTTNLISGGYLNATANNTVMRSSSGADVPFMPGYTPSDYPWAMWAPSIGADSYLSYILYTAESSGGEIRYFPDTGGMTTVDNASLELGDNFTIEQSGWIDTTAGASENLTDKPNAFTAFIDPTVSGNITSRIGGWYDPTGFNDPDGAWTQEASAYDDNGDTFAQSPVGATSWGSFLEFTCNSMDVNRIRYKSTSDAGKITLADIDLFYNGGWRDFYQGTDTQGWFTRPTDNISNSVTQGRMRFYNNDGGGATAYIYEFDFGLQADVSATGISSGEHITVVNTQPVVTDQCAGGAPTTDGSDAVNAFDNNAGTYWSGDSTDTWITYDFGVGNGKAIAKYTLLNRAGVTTQTPKDWTFAGSNDDSAWTTLDTKTGETIWVDGVARTFTFSNITAYRYWRLYVTACNGGSPCTLAEIEMMLGNFWISVDGIVHEVKYTAVTVPDNANNWVFLQNGAMPYMEYHKISVNGTLQQHIVWEYGTTFSDQSGNGNIATPTFRSASSAPDVTANMTAFLPIAEAKAPDYALGTAPAFIDPDITGNVTATFTTTPPAGGFPLAGVIIAIANATGTPEQLPLLIVAGFIILAASLSMSAIMRKYGSGTLVVKIVAIVAFMGIFIALKNFGIDFWMLVVFLVISIALSMGSRQLGWT